MSDIAISVKNLSKKYHLYESPQHRLKEALHPFRKKYHREFWALKSASFDIQKGKCVGIVGRNGSGKSTLLQLLCGILQPTEGETQIKGRISALLELGAGFNPEFTGRDNVYMNGAVMGFAKSEIDEKFDIIAGFADIGEFIDQPVKTYSSGMYVRLAFALAINVKPDILIIDEALAVGDVLFQKKCYDKIQLFMSDGKTILFVTHDLNTLNQLCSHAILLDGGELILKGKAKLVTTYYERLLFSTPENFLKIRQEIETIKIKHDLREGLDGSSLVKNSFRDTEEIALESSKAKPYYLPELVPKSTLEYKNYDVEMFDIHIVTPDGEKANALVMNQEYVITYKVLFHIDAEDVSFGFFFKTEKGLILGAAASFAMKKAISSVIKGETYKVDWHFKCSFLPNTYFVDIGVSSIIDSNRVYLNRIIDSLVFTVQPEADSGHYGFVTFNQYPVINKMSENI